MMPPAFATMGPPALAPTLPLCAGCSAFVEGGGAERVQVARARAAFAVSRYAPPTSSSSLSGRFVAYVAASVLSPQWFVHHPRIEDMAGEPAVGIDTAAPRLPGRLPLGAWDGEPGAAAPAIGNTGGE